MTFEIVASGEILGARIVGQNLARVDDERLSIIIDALGRYGVLCFPEQTLSPRDLKNFSARLGDLEINVAGSHQVPGLPEVMILSNLIENGHPVGLADAGQSWHTDMSYSAQIAFANVLHAIKVPRRNGIALGATQFCDMCAAYDDLDQALKARLLTLRAQHDFERFWELMRKRPGSKRAALTAEQRKAKPPVIQPMVIRHPISGRLALYANPGYTCQVIGLPPGESDELLHFLFAHQTQEKYRYQFDWRVGDVLLWDNLRVIHQAVADYSADEHRLMYRCQVMATRFSPVAATPTA